MKLYEYEEIARLPNKYRPLTAWNYFWLNVLYSIPIIGWIFLIVFACSDENVSRRSHARSYFCGILLVAIACAVILVLLVVSKSFDFDFLSVFKSIF